MTTVPAYRVERKLRPTGPWQVEEGLSEISPELYDDAAATVARCNERAGWTVCRLVANWDAYEACLAYATTDHD